MAAAFMITIEKLNKDDFEQVVFCNDKTVGLKAIIAIHDTTLGPGTGGCRFYPYKTEEEALTDVLRLAKGMTYKSAISRIPFGGGKAVIIGDPHQLKNERLLERFGEFVNYVGGRYITAKDVGVDGHDLQVISRKTKHILGIEGAKNSSGDPSPATAFGIFHGIRAIAKEIFKKESLKGLHFAIQGVGYVGYHLALDLHKEGATITICDVDKEALHRCQEKLPVTVVDPSKIYDVPCDFFVPCAMGAILNRETIPRLKCRVVAGAANNQLATLQDGYDLISKNIFYAPDYALNAGGIINIAEELQGYDQKRAYDRISHIYETMIEIIRRSEKEKKPTFLIANQMAEEIIESAKKRSP